MLRGRALIYVDGMGVRYRVEQARAEWRLRTVSVGRWAECRGRPIIEVTDAAAGDSFRVHSIEATTVLRGGGRLRFGDDVYLNSGVRIECDAEVTIGDHVLLAYGAVVTDTDSHGMEGRPTRVEPVRIGSGAWVGARAMILPGVTIGRRAIVGAGSVVTWDVPDDVLVAGNPARVVRPLAHEPGRERAAN